jgi:hypothetical protein
LVSKLGIPSGWKVFWGNSEYYSTEDEESFSADQRPTFTDHPLKQARALGLPYWFVAGYGVTRSLPLPMNSERLVDPVLERLAPLFDRGRIIGTGFLELFEDSQVVDSYIDGLMSALIAEKALLPRIQTMELSRWQNAKQAKSLPDAHRFGFQAGDDVVRVPATWLSHGYQAMISWVADLIGQIFWDSGQAIALDAMEGLVLIDELDLHLHPLWQVGLVRALKATFPRIQFIATTHSPMLLPGLESDEIRHLRLDDEGNVRVETVDQSPALMTGSEIYQSFFGIDRLYPTDLGEALRRYGYLSSDPGRSDEEEQEMIRHRAKLKKAGIDPGWEPTPRRERR